MNTDTPRTDAEMDDARNVALEFSCRNPAVQKDENCYVVPADFARQLERELSEWRKVADELAASVRLWHPDHGVIPNPALAAYEKLKGAS